MLVAPHSHNPLTLLRFAAKAAPAMLATVTSTLPPHVCYYSRHRVSRSMPTCAPHMVYLLKRHRCDLVCVHPSQSRPHSHMSVPPKWEHILCAQLQPTREVQVPPWREPTILLVQILVQELVFFLNHEPWFFLWSNLVNPKLTGLVTLIQPTAISCIINTVSLFFSGIQDRRAGTLPKFSRRPVEGSMRLFFRESSTSKGSWGMVLLIVRALLRRPPFSGTSTVTFCSVHIHNVVAKKRDASTDQLQRPHGYMKQDNVDIGGDST